MKQIPDAPIISSVEQTGFPPWLQNWHEVDDDDLYCTHEEDGYDREECYAIYEGDG